MPESLESLPSISTEHYVRQASPNDLVLTASNRLAREITAEFSRSGSGSVTLLPRVLPYPAWLRQCWQELQFHAILSGDETFRGAKLLNDSQEEMLWERTLRGMGAERRALFLDDTVQACLRSASLVDQYNISLSDEAWRIDEESAVFDSWHSKLREECRSRRLVRTSRLPVFLAKRMEQLASLHGVRLILAGFDEPMPAQLNLLLSAAKVSRDALLLDSRKGPPSVPEHIYRSADAEEELWAAAAWAKQELDANAGARIAVVVPDLASRRSLVVEVFDAVFGAKEGTLPHSNDHRPFQVSLGERLGATPVARALLSLLPLLQRRSALEDASALLRSPYFAHAALELAARARMETLLHRDRREDVSLERLQTAAIDVEARTGASLAHCKSALLAMESFDASGEHSSSVWAARLRTLCFECLWLGDPSLSSAEFQARHRVLEELGGMAELDVVAATMHFRDFERVLRRRFDAATFQPESPPRPLLIAGLYEVTGLRFDAAWVCGLTDGVLPRPLQLDPFVPRGLQRSHDLPRCDAKRERGFAERSFARLLRLAPRMVVSFPAAEKQEQLEPSPLLRELAFRHRLEVTSVPPSLPPAALDPARLDEREDWFGGPLPASEKRVQRGSQVLADQSACPFRAFARTRLGSDVQEPELAVMNRMDQGKCVHRALELFWERTASLDGLLGLRTDALDNRIAECAQEALAEFRVGEGDVLAAAQRDAELIRLTRLLSVWMEHERRRQPFRIVETERRHTVDLGSIELRIRPDRIDQLADGSLALVDYKTGFVERTMWDGERPEQPQLLLYLAAAERPVSAVAFGCLKTGHTGWELYGEDVPGQFSAKKKHSGLEGGWPGFVSRSQEAVERLTREFREGFAAVDPLQGADTCKYCEQKPFCRVAEAALPAADDGGQEAD